MEKPIRLNISRRHVLGQGLGLGLCALGTGVVGLALPKSAPAQSFGASDAAPADPPLSGEPITVPAGAHDLTAYERRIVDVARRELERQQALLWRQDIVAVADFARPSALPRIHFVDMEAGRLRSYLVAHGRGSDPDHSGWLERFSNTVGSEATSRGAYLTCACYEGKYGPSIRLRGLDADNSNALDRAIVMHPAWYAASEMLPRYGKLGRSEGCFAMDPADFSVALNQLAAGRLLFADRIGEG
ncbi:MAG TPA: murein L,D-transpeptidase catalytic domain family protein [Novosphingobium sp.]|nr:murein L,D-transpeptidase catalytic domain family protein [Novosphingobium sp.]HZV09799.1 murein L,D-transpeptidase catalytic domain family protein [Novosphingobium sp.]